MDERALQQQIQEFTRRFGLLNQDGTPCQYPISPSQAHALQVLGTQEKTPQSLLAQQLNLEKSTISRLITQLVEREWVQRTINAENRREVNLTLTDAGKVVLDDLLMAGAAKYHRLWTRLPQDKKSQIIEALALLNKALLADQE
ncbi:hypothetical protein KSF_047050 [Reticulibacter mediterranei]|uniref:HTH marR-type domain-containing protein n=1 Tax=Reticulibacter mediterranei TaxID=2778369 RepID=A0A8J3N1W0_9CHLR|nr:MarR family transcriptional regulator [Reticulibacter mediterranei]GHO94657.1 hypothetical protein KSF_047050 [Reticulibacter mediterranei]